MKIKQWIYTTSCWNIRGQSGWNTFSYSHGLTNAEVDELEHKCQIPGNLESEYFPVFETITLESGRKVICQTAAPGCSFYDGRPGATLTHAFIIDAGEEWPLPPVAYIGSSNFWQDLPEHLKQQALDYRDNGKGPDRPDYLPELDERELNPGEDYTMESMQHKLHEPETAAAVSAVLHELFLLEEEQYPLRYSCEASRSNSVLAALYYLAPSFLEGQGAASVYRTGGSITQYNFLRLTGTRDSNAHVRAESYRGEIHPLLRAARENLPAWHDFCKQCRLEDTSGFSALADLFYLIHGPKLSSVTAEVASAVLAVPEDVPGTAVKKKIGSALAATHEIELSGELFMLLSTRLLRLFNQTLYDFDEGEKTAWRTLIHTILAKAAALTSLGELEIAQAAGLCTLNPSLPKLWLSDKWLNNVFSACASPLQQLPLLRLTMHIAADAGDTGQLWLESTSTGRALVGRLAHSTSLWEVFTSETNTPNDIARLCVLWAQLCKAEPAAPEIQREIMDKCYRSLTDEQRCELQKLFLQRNMVHSAIQAFLSTQPDRLSFGALMSQEKLFSASPAYEEQLLLKALDGPGTQAYSLPEGYWLLRELKKYTAHKQLCSKLTDCLFGGLRFTALTRENILYMRELASSLRRIPLSAERERHLDFLASLHTMQEIAREQPESLADWLLRYALPALGAVSTASSLSAEEQKLYRPLFLRYALEQARDKTAFKLLMQTADWGWSQACFISACKEMIQTQASQEPFPALPAQLISLLAALVEAEDLYLLRCVLDSNGGLLFSGLSKSKASSILLKLKMSVGSHHDDAITLVKQSISKNHKSLMNKLLTKIFK